VSDAFFGRAKEVPALLGTLERGERVVTVVGPPGVGKSRLARRVAELWSERTASALFVDLAEATDAGGIAVALSSALGTATSLGGGGGDPLLAAAQGLAVRGPVLVVLDDFDRLVRWALVTVHRWRELASGAQFLVTSRERLRIPEEVVFEIGPLPAPDDGGLDSDAALLLLDRARRVRGELTPSAADALALARIASLLEGNPLAIELAAARLDVLDPPALLARLADRFAVLVEGRPGRSLTGALDCSWQLLSDGERAALAQCTVFRGGFSIEAAEAVLALPASETRPVLDVVQALRDRSLLRATDAPGAAGRRLGLYAAIRDFAARQLAPDEAGAVRARHLAHYALRADSWRQRVPHSTRRGGLTGPDGRTASWSRQVSVEQENLLAAVAYGLEEGAPGPARKALAIVWALDALPAVRLSLDEHLALLDRALAAATGPDVEPLLHATVLVSRGRALRRAGRNADGARDLAIARQLAQAAGDATLEGRALHGLGRILILQDRLVDAEESLQRGLALHREAHDRRFEAMTLSALGYVLLQRDDTTGAANRAGEALACARELDDAHAEAECLYFLALVHHHAARLEAAREVYAAARRAAESVGEVWIAAFCQVETGLVLLEEGRIAEARAVLERAEPSLVGFDPRGEGLVLSHVAAAKALSGDLQDAGWLFDRAERLLQATDVALLPAVIGPQRGLLDLARASRARAAGDEEGARALELRAAERLTTARRAGRPDAEVSRGASIVNTDLVVATRILEAALRDRGLVEGGARTARALVVEPEGRWFEPPGGERVSCERRRPLRRILLALARARVDTPGRSLPREELQATGWPGERPKPAAARNRLDVALHELRKLGLRGILRATDAGCRFDEAVPLRWGT
jgi:predicted ATPase